MKGRGEVLTCFPCHIELYNFNFVFHVPLTNEEAGGGGGRVKG